MDTWDIQSLLRVSFKTRLDGYTDQYNRILMVKVLLACTFIMGINWYEDKMNCIIPASHATSKQFAYFVQSACWMQGLYVYKEMRSRMGQAAFYGIPINIEFDGLQSKQFPCISEDEFAMSHTYYNAVQTQTCIPMKKTFYLQYQWMPFYIGLLSFIYYLPFMVFRLANKDIVCLEDDAEICTPQEIIQHYFHDLGVSIVLKNKRKFIKRLLKYLLIKFLYVSVNIGALLTSDRLLEGEFLNYVPKWVYWSKFNNSISYDYMGARNFPKPGNELLPPFGYCEVFSSAKDEVRNYANKHKLVCELSQHILYQYVFILLWVCIIVGLAVSIIGLLLSLINCGILCHKYSNEDDRKSWKFFSKFLTYRHREYLELLKKTNINMYDEVVRNLDTIATKKGEEPVSVRSSTPMGDSGGKMERSNHNGDIPMADLIKRRCKKALSRKDSLQKKESYF